MNRVRHLLLILTLLACGGMLLVLAWGPAWTSRWIARSLQQRIARSDEAAAASLVDQLALLGDAALPPLVELLDDPRSEVRRAARDALWSKVESAGPESTALLIRTLASFDGPHDLQGKLFARQLATRVLRQTA